MHILLFDSFLNEHRIIDKRGNPRVYRAGEVRSSKTNNRMGEIILTDPSVASYKLKDMVPSDGMYPWIPEECCVLVNHDAGTVDLNNVNFFDSRSRRPNTSDAKSKASYTIPKPSVAFDGKLLNFQKFLKSLLKHDPEIISLRIAGSNIWDGKSVGEILELHDSVTDTSTKTTGEIVLYHGTSLKQWEVIQREGLRPGKHRSVYYDLIQGYSEENVYLTTSVTTARNYATRAAVWDKSAAVVLEVVVKDFTRLRPDEDNMNWFPIINSDGKPDEVHMKWQKPGTPRFIQGYNHFVSKMPELMRRNATVAYKGFIRPEHITVEESYKYFRMKHDPEFDEYHTALKKAENSIVKGPIPVKTKPRK